MKEKRLLGHPQDSVLDEDFVFANYICAVCKKVISFCACGNVMATLSNRLKRYLDESVGKLLFYQTNGNAAVSNRKISNLYHFQF